MNSFKTTLSLAVTGALVLGGCNPIKRITNYIAGMSCPDTTGTLPYSGWEIIRENGKEIGIILKRNVAVGESSVSSNAVSTGKTTFFADDGELNRGDREAMTARGMEELGSDTLTTNAGQYSTAAQPRFPDHIWACLDSLNFIEVDAKGLSNTPLEVNVEYKGNLGGTERRG
jgi:hypothetical protein